MGAVAERGSRRVERRGSQTLSTSTAARGASATRSWASDSVLLLLLVALGLLSRVFTTNSLAGEPSSDEYYFALHARDLARSWLAGADGWWGALGGEGRMLAVEAAALSYVLPWDQITAGRTVQALLNALCVPMTYVLGRQVGLARGAAGAAALLLMASPEFLEFAWRFWSDSQATFLSLAYLACLVAFARRPAPAPALLAPASLGLLFLTKDSAAVTLAPFLPLAMAAPLRHWLPGWRLRLGLVGGLLLLAVVVVGALLSAGPVVDRLADVGLLGRVLQVGRRVVAALPALAPRLPIYADQLTALFGPFELSVGLVWAWALGGVWLLLQAGWALVVPSASTSLRLGWLAAALAWAPLTTIPLRRLGSFGQVDPWVALAAASLLAATGLAGLHLGDARRRSWGLAFLGLVTLAFAAQRFLLWATPDLPAAFTFRSFMPVAPVIALVAGAGVWGAMSAARLLLPSLRSSHALATIAATLLLVAIWSPLVNERLSREPLLGRRADRGADPAKAEGLRVEALVAAEEWLKANLQPTDTTITSLPRQLAWYADLGADGLDRLVNLGAHARTEAERRALIMESVAPTGVAYVVDFNVAWTQPDSAAAREWRQTYDWLSSRPNVETAYLRRDRFGYPVFYVVRNHGYAASYSYRDRETIRAEEAARRRS